MTQIGARLKVSKLKRVALLKGTNNASFKLTLIESFYSTDVVHCLFKYMLNWICDEN